MSDVGEGWLNGTEARSRMTADNRRPGEAIFGEFVTVRGSEKSEAD
jgi:hypothetical protein